MVPRKNPFVLWAKGFLFWEGSRWRVRGGLLSSGQHSLTSAAGALLQERLIELAKAIDTLQDEGWEPVLVSSGAVATGLGELGWRRENLTMPERQAAAAVGQGLLMEKYNQVLGPTISGWLKFCSPGMTWRSPPLY